MCWMNSKTKLMTHQQTAADKLMPIRLGALFMEMGTGKSRTVIEMVLRRQKRLDLAAWFCPVSLKETVRREILKHTDTPPEQINVFDDKTASSTLPKCFWHVVGIESIAGSTRIALAVKALLTENSMAIVDESSYIKGHRALRTQRLTAFAEKCRYRVLLTGTPISQGVVDLFAQMRFLSPKILGYRSFYSFAANHLEYSDKYPGMIVKSHNQAYIAAKIQPYVFQVTKKECLDLPPKTYKSRFFSMTVTQRDLYEEAKQRTFESMEDDELDSYAIFRLFGALQQIVSGYWNDIELQTRHEVYSPRLAMLLDTVADLPPDEKIIIWAKFEYDIMEIQSSLAAKYGPESVALFYGKLNEAQRTASVDRFCNGARFFVATQSCGGHGLTLVQARYVIFYNNEFKYATRLQAEDRCHRIGQERDVHYIDLVCANSIDERIMSALSAKGDAVRQFKGEIDKVKHKKTDIKKLIEGL